MFLQIKLPSGRVLSYPFPRIIKDDRGNSRVLFSDNAKGQFRDCRNGDGAYGGTWTENIVSGISRDLLVEAMLRVEAANYKITLHVHDELCCGVPVSFGGGRIAELMSRRRTGLGIYDRGKCQSGPRYVK
jgi:DNA polymerase